MAEAHHDPRKTIKTELPADLIFYNILPKLPAKYLVNCMCVSKKWHSFLKTPAFTQLHQHHLTNDNHQNHHKLLVFSTKTTPRVFHTIDCEAPEDGLTASRPFPFVGHHPVNMRVLTSFGGLVCVGIKSYFRNNAFQYSDLILWNPLTGEFKILSKPKSHNEIYERRGNLFGLYYSSCDDDYKLLCVTLDFHAYIYSLKSDAWRKIDSTEQLKRINYWVAQRWSPCTLLNEKLYFLNRINYLKGEPLHRLTHSIIRFDTKTEKFTVIATPIPGNRYVTCMSHQGCLHLYVAYTVFESIDTLEMTVELWRLKGDAEWKMVVTYPINKHSCWTSTHPVHLRRDGNWLTIDGDFGQVFKLDLARSIKDPSWSYTGCGSIYIHTGEKYIETLVSPDRYL